MSVARGFPNAGHFYSNIVKPIKIDCNFIVDATNGNGLGVRSIKSNGYVRNVFMHTSATPGPGEGLTNPNPASGYCLIQMKQNFNVYLGGFSGFVSPVTGSNITVASSSVLTIGSPYIITVVGTVPKPKFTVLAIADSSQNSAGKYFTATDVFSNNYVFYNVVSGTGTPPSLTGVLAGYTAVPVAYATNAANTAVATAVSNAVAAVNGTNSFTTSISTATVTITSAGAYNLQFPIAPLAQTSGFTVGAVTYTTLAADWQTLGVPAGLTPAVGMSFIALTTGSALNSGTVKAPGVSGITSVEIIGDPNTSIANSAIANNGGAWLLVQFLGQTLTIGSYTPAGTITNGTPDTFTGTPATLTGTVTLGAVAPAAGSVVGMSFFFDGSSVTVDGL